MPPPIIKTCILCDDVRFEVRNVLSLMGVYGLAPDAAVFVNTFPQAAKLCFVFFGEPRAGKFRLDVELRGPDGILPARPFPPYLELPLEVRKGGFFAAFWFQNAVFPKSGQYTIALRVDGNEYFTTTFEVLPTQERIPSYG